MANILIHLQLQETALQEIQPHLYYQATGTSYKVAQKRDPGFSLVTLYLLVPLLQNSLNLLHKYLQVAQLLQRDRATHELLRFAKLQSRIFEPPFWGLRGNVGASCVRHWRNRGRLPIGDN